MASRIEHRAEFTEGVDEVLTALSAEDVLRARLAELGGTGAALLKHSVSGDDVTFTLRQGIPAEVLPQAVRSFHSGDLIVRRQQTFRRSGEGYTGTAKATVDSVPGEISARTDLTPSGNGSTLRNSGEVKVRIPLIGGKLEGVIAEQVTKLLEREAEFTARWLARPN
ncbi:hypothetical protein CFN78_00355 [Amycolatopsis antarctica]|uniref:DUF2505 domain-containing protein n=1 Tax=Amycolatopsis antarctica TaxID=1854586 RepID=A0A263D8L6_9PSEU|nr:DUF2505 domain-containing protein [Amycolatopsis antarctica]OZM74731.1 hypothetical protein CFN78_00355 [Amycolatopsis antarctica]